MVASHLGNAVATTGVAPVTCSSARAFTGDEGSRSGEEATKGDEARGATIGEGRSEDVVTDKPLAGCRTPELEDDNEPTRVARVGEPTG